MENNNKCLVYLGTDKTGTTSVQSFFGENQEEISKHINWSNVGRHWDNHIGLAQSIGFDSDRTFYNGGLVEEFLQDVRKTKKNVFLCSEQFTFFDGYLPIIKLYEMLEDNFSDFKAILILRKPTSYYISSYIESLKWGNTSTFDEFVSEKMLLRDVIKLGENVKDIFKEKVSIYNYSDIKNNYASSGATLGLILEQLLNFADYDKTSYDGLINKIQVKNIIHNPALKKSDALRQLSFNKHVHNLTPAELNHSNICRLFFHFNNMSFTGKKIDLSTSKHSKLILERLDAQYDESRLFTKDNLV